jgi:cation diffusion facilitator family transporter
VRVRVGLLEGWVSAVLNLVLAGIKLALGVMLRSAGLISDAVHSLGDLATSLVVIIGFRASRKPPDAEHPFGHAKAEYVATLIIAILLVVAGVEIGQETVRLLIAGGPGAPGVPLTWGLFFVLLALLIAKELLAGFSNALGELIQSDALKADGWHHRTDALTTGIVIVGLAGRNFGLPWLDGVAGLIVAVFIVGTGVQMAYKAVSPLLGEAATAAELESIRNIAQHVVGIESVHDIRVQRYGDFFFTTIHVEMADTINVHKMHEIAVQLEMRVLNKHPGECVVHVDPIDFNHPLFNRVAEALRDVVLSHPDLLEFHDLQLRSGGKGEEGDVEIAVEPEAPEDSHGRISGHVIRELERRFPELKMTVRLKVDFSAAPITQ